MDYQPPGKTTRKVAYQGHQLVGVHAAVKVTVLVAVLVTVVATVDVRTTV
jgi:hypothetical protein